MLFEQVGFGPIIRKGTRSPLAWAGKIGNGHGRKNFREMRTLRRGIIHARIYAHARGCAGVVGVFMRDVGGERRQRGTMRRDTCKKVAKNGNATRVKRVPFLPVLR